MHPDDAYGRSAVGAAVVCLVCLVCLISFVGTAGAQAPTPTICGAWQTVMAYQSPTPTATPTTYVDLAAVAVSLPAVAVVSDSLAVDIEVRNIGTADRTADTVVLVSTGHEFQPSAITWTGDIPAGELVRVRGVFAPVPALYAWEDSLHMAVEVSITDAVYGNNLAAADCAVVTPTPDTDDFYVLPSGRIYRQVREVTSGDDALGAVGVALGVWLAVVITVYIGWKYLKGE